MAHLPSGAPWALVDSSISERAAIPSPISPAQLGPGSRQQAHERYAADCYRVHSGAGGSLQFEALLDTGSVATVFRREVAEAIGVVVRGNEDAGIRWRGKRYAVEYQTVKLQLAQGTVNWTWDARVGFSSAEIGIALLGQKGCLEYLDAKFCGAQQVVEVETNSSFPGSISAATPRT